MALLAQVHSSAMLTHCSTLIQQRSEACLLVTHRARSLTLTTVCAYCLLQAVEAMA